MSTMLTHQDNCSADPSGDDEMYDLTPEELRVFDLQAEQAYRTMAGLDEPLEARAKRARFDARRTPLTRTKSW